MCVNFHERQAVAEHEARIASHDVKLLQLADGIGPLLHVSGGGGAWHVDAVKSLHAKVVLNLDDGSAGGKAVARLP